MLYRLRSSPSLERVADPSTGLTVRTDPHLLADTGILVAFSERTGGVSLPPYATLNLAAHVGDDSALVDENRTRLLSMAGIGNLRKRLITAEQVHADSVEVVTAVEAGSGAFASDEGRPPVPATDALVTTTPELPLMMLFADCVPVVIVALRPCRGVAIAHAGWRSALAGIAGKTARELAERTGTDASNLLAYIGPSIGICCFEVNPQITSRFTKAFGTIAAVGRRVDLVEAVVQDLGQAGISRENVVVVDSCTMDETHRFFSYRASAVTGRHAVLASIARGD